MAKRMLMGLGVMSNQLFRVNQQAKEMTGSLYRMLYFLSSSNECY